MSKKSDKKSESAAADPKNVVAGPKVVEETVTAQAREARGDKDKAKDNGGDASLRPKTFANEEALKHRDETKEARVKHLKSIGIDPEAVAGDSIYRVEEAETKDKMFSGVVTMTGYSGEYQQKVSQRIDIGPTPRGWDWCANWCFKHHCGFNCTLVEIDEKNEADPLLRTTHG